MHFVNLTPHQVNTPDFSFEPSGQVANVREEDSGFEYDHMPGVRVDRLASVQGLPDPQDGTVYIVSMPTLMAVRAMGDDRTDLVTPITRGPGVVKNEKGQIAQVPGFRTF